jgi:hypothetical protein
MPWSAAEWLRARGAPPRGAARNAGATGSACEPTAADTAAAGRGRRRRCAPWPPLESRRGAHSQALRGTRPRSPARAAPPSQAAWTHEESGWAQRRNALAHLRLRLRRGWFDGRRRGGPQTRGLESAAPRNAWTLPRRVAAGVRQGAGGAACRARAPPRRQWRRSRGRSAQMPPRKVSEGRGAVGWRGSARLPAIPRRATRTSPRTIVRHAAARNGTACEHQWPARLRAVSATAPRWHRRTRSPAAQECSHAARSGARTRAAHRVWTVCARFLQRGGGAGARRWARRGAQAWGHAPPNGARLTAHRRAGAGVAATPATCHARCALTGPWHAVRARVSARARK